MDQTPPKPPDGGWGWVIVFACFLCNFVIGNQNCFVLFEWTLPQRKDVGVPLAILPHVREQNIHAYFPRPGQS